MAWLRLGGMAGAALMVVAVTAPAAAADAPVRCANPAAGTEMRGVEPAAVGMDARRLEQALAFGTSRLSGSIRVYRHGCLAARSVLDPFTENTPGNVWSSTKGVVSLLTGIAVTDGRLGLDDPVGRYLPQADPAHARITVRQLLTQTSGLRFAWTSDVAARDQVAFTLALPFAHPPGSYFEYAQSTVTLLGAVVEAAVGEELDAFAARRLFEPLGITPGQWRWPRDRAGNVQGFAFLELAPRAMGRLGQLMLQEGTWRDRRLIGADYLRRMREPSPANPGYGFLVWTNAGGRMITATMPSRQVLDQPPLPGAPADSYAFVGFMGQLVIVVPSLDLVVVRTGLPGNRDPDLQSLLTAKAGDLDYELVRGILGSVRDTPVPDPGPYRPVVRFDPFDVTRIFDLPTLWLALLS